MREFWNGQFSTGLYESYLHPRQMKVGINNVYSKELTIKYRVPQGSCSGANNFTAYCSLIEDTVPKCVNLIGCADNHSLCKSFKASNHNQESETSLTLQNTVSSIATWMSEMRLKLNCDKTQLILIGNQRQLDKCTTTNLQLDGNLINVSNYVK